MQLMLEDKLICLVWYSTIIGTMHNPRFEVL